ncbi:MAG: hypothetical protein LBS10_10420 [Gracilibacteraceae bacterium]|jgi:hypothetical protein|nr:hypothetical protein [Gracilibacteraceae bacterium]
MKKFSKSSNPVLLVLAVLLPALLTPAAACNVFLGRYLTSERQTPESAIPGEADAAAFQCAIPEYAALDIKSALNKACSAWRLYGTYSLYWNYPPVAAAEGWTVSPIYFHHNPLGGIPEANRPTAAQDSAAYIDTVNQLLYYDSFIDRSNAKKAELQKIIMLHDFMGQHLQWDYNNPKIDAAKFIYSDTIANGNARNFESCGGHVADFSNLADILGLETGWVRNTHEVSHGWNTVRYSGDWYHLDSRMDDYGDPAPGANTYRYALKSDADLQAAYYIYRGLWGGYEGEYDPALFTKSVPAADIRAARLKIENYPYKSNQLVQDAGTAAKPVSRPATLDGTAQTLSLYNIGGRLFVKLENIINSAGAGLYTTGDVISVFF